MQRSLEYVETFVVGLDKIPDNVSSMFFLVSSYHGENLTCVENYYLSIKEQKNEIATYTTVIDPVKKPSAMLVGRITRENKDDVWGFKAMTIPLMTRSFIDVLPSCREYLRDVLPKIPLPQRPYSVNMVKGEDCLLDESLSEIVLGFGWEKEGEPIDIEASCIAYDFQGRDLGLAYFGKEEAFKGAIRHYGDDNLDGMDTEEDKKFPFSYGYARLSDGDEEKIHVNLNQLPGVVRALGFSLTCFTSHTFDVLKKAHVRLLKEKGVKGSNLIEIIRFDLKEFESISGLIFVTLYRDPRGLGWRIRAEARARSANTYKAMKNHMAKVINNYELPRPTAEEASINLANMETRKECCGIM